MRTPFVAAVLGFVTQVNSTRLIQTCDAILAQTHVKEKYIEFDINLEASLPQL